MKMLQFDIYNIKNTMAKSYTVYCTLHAAHSLSIRLAISSLEKMGSTIDINKHQYRLVADETLS